MKNDWLFTDDGRTARLFAEGGELTPDSAIRLARTLLDWGLREQDQKRADARRKRAEKKEATA